MLNCFSVASTVLCKQIGIYCCLANIVSTRLQKRGFRQGKMAAWKNVTKVNRALFPQFESLKQGRLAKAYLLVTDYKAVAKSAVIYIREKPIKFASQLGILGLCAYCSSQRPDLQSYADELFKSSNDLLQVSSLVRNKASDAIVRDLITSYHQNRLVCKNLGLFSIILKYDFPDECDAYDKNCYYVQPRWIKLYERIVDIGMLGRWFMLEKAMVDYDVNDDEFV